MTTINTESSQAGQWAIVEIMGHKVVAGYITKDEQFGAAMMRIDIPATSAYPAFTQLYGVSALYGITFVSEDVARRAAEANKVNPVSVYVPDLSDLQALRERYNALREEIARLRSLPAPVDHDDDDDDDDDDDPDTFRPRR